MNIQNVSFKLAQIYYAEKKTEDGFTVKDGFLRLVDDEGRNFYTSTTWCQPLDRRAHLQYPRQIFVYAKNKSGKWEGSWVDVFDYYESESLIKIFDALYYLGFFPDEDGNDYEDDDVADDNDYEDGNCADCPYINLRMRVKMYLP